MLEKKNSRDINIKALSRKKKVTDSLVTLELPVKRKVARRQIKLLKRQENILKQYERAKRNQSVIVFENFQKKLIEALAIVDSNLW